MDDRIERLGGIQRFADSYRIYNPWRDKVRRGTLDISARSNDSKFPFHRPWNNRNAVRSNEKGLIFYDPIFFLISGKKVETSFTFENERRVDEKTLIYSPSRFAEEKTIEKKKNRPFFARRWIIPWPSTTRNPRIAFPRSFPSLVSPSTRARQARYRRVLSPSVTPKIQ